MGGYIVRIFVTVGTTAFDPLVEAIDKGPHAADALIQIADGEYKPTKAEWFVFRPGIQKYIDEAEIVVCHAGCASVFQMLDSGIVPLVVPNTIRRDKHQLEIARWVERKNYGVVAMNPEQVNDALSGYPEKKEHCVSFNEKRFFYQEYLDSQVRKYMNIDD